MLTFLAIVIVMLIIGIPRVLAIAFGLIGLAIKCAVLIGIVALFMQLAN